MAFFRSNQNKKIKITIFLPNFFQYMPHIKTHSKNFMSMQIILDDFDFQNKFKNWLSIHQRQNVYCQVRFFEKYFFKKANVLPFPAKFSKNI